MKILKSTFVPHKGNKYKPHVIKHHFLLIALLFLGATQAFINHSATGSFQILGYATNVNSGDLLSLTNQNRSSNGLGSLKSNSQLAVAAQNKANHMIANDYWAHIAPDGTTPWFFVSNAGYSYERAGENLAYGFATSSGVVTGWMNSPSHAANILDSTFEDVGFGIANGANFQGGENTVVVAMYGQPTALTKTPAPSANQEAAPSSQQQTQSPSEEKSKQKKPSDKKNEAPQNTEEETELNSQYLLANLDDDTEISVSQRAASGLASETITVFEALITGQAHWFLYMSLGLLLTVGAIYAVRHATALYHLVVKGEHYVEGHPLLEASIIYGAIWLILVSSYGVIL